MKWSCSTVHDNSSQDLPNSDELSEGITFGFCDGSRNFRRLLRLLRIVVSARILLYLLSGQILNHDCVSVIVSRFTSFTENFVIRRYQVTKHFCSWNRSLTASFGSQAYVAISVFGEVSFNTVLPFFLSTFEASPSESEISLSEECASTCVSRSSRLSVKGCNESGMPCVGTFLFISFFMCWSTVSRG